jgi:hypothetical protein
VNYESVNGQTISVGGDQKLPVKGRGVVTFHTQSDSNIAIDITLMDVLHVPDLGIDLISLGTLHCKGASFATAGNSFIVSFNS